ncbi:MAG: hypothetical protein ACTHNN_00330 [Xanthobacteraceae bacterium]
MVDKLAPLGHGEINALILQALVHKLIAKNILSVEDLRELLFDAATRLDLDGSPQTPQAARIIVEEDLMPAFWRDDRAASYGSPSATSSVSGKDK